MRIMTYLLFLLFLVVSSPASAAGCLVDGEDPHLCQTREIRFTGDDGQKLADKAQALGTPAKIYEYLRNSAEYSLYHGARSNSINTFFGLRGNDVDLASTLLAMLRSQGIKARYVEGNIKLSRDVLANWLEVLDNTLAVELLRDQGIQVLDDSNPDFVVFQHVWVEALIKYDHYRGGNANAAAACAAENQSCRWVPLDASFKQRVHKEINRMLLRDFAFDYTAYYNAQNPDSPSFQEGMQNKSPLEIYEEQALNYLRTHHPGVTLEDVIDEGQIIREEAGLLPASLPYAVSGALTRYDSIDEHDAVAEVVWTKYLRSKIDWPECDNFSGLWPSYEIPLAELSTKQLTVTLFTDQGSAIFGHRLDGQKAGGTVQIGGGVNFVCSDGITRQIGENSLVDLTLEVDIEPGQQPVSVTYNNLVVGGYYLIASGGETSNATQIRRAYEKLLQANNVYQITIDETGMLGTIGAVYVDKNSSGTADTGDVLLIDDLEAQDALTGGLLYVAQSIYYTRLREESERYGRLKGIISPISAYLGVVSTTQSVEYLDDVPFAVTPGGLLIDLKGIRLNGSWEIDKPDVYSSEAFRFLGHIGSSLEHEVWQTITSYDAISTMHGIQFALEQGHTLLDIRKNTQEDTFPAVLVELGFASTPPGDFERHEYSLFNRRLVSWGYSGVDSSAAFHAFLPDITGLDPEIDTNTFLATHQADQGMDDFFSSYDSAENSLIIDQANEGQLKSNIEISSSGSIYQSYDVLSATIASPEGFAVAGFSRVAADSYQYIVNETSQHLDGSYPVTIAFDLADGVDEKVFNFSGLSVYTVLSISATSPAGFTVTNYTQPDAGGTATVTIGESGSHTDGNHTVGLKFTLLANSSIYTWSPGVNIKVIGNRFVDNSATLTTGAIDVSDNQTLGCHGGANGEIVDYTGPPSTLLTNLENCFNNYNEVKENLAYVNFFDRNQDFDPNAYVYRSTDIAIDEYDTNFILQIRNDMYLTQNGWAQYLLPSRLPQDTYYLFSVYTKNLYNSTDDLARSTYAIVNHSNRLPAGGGYVTAVEALDPANSPDFNNAVFTDLSLVSVSNNDLIRTPSTADPVSTVTGNMYHDETDLAIKGRGLDYAFTRTYNSDQSTHDATMGFGWTHSYNMRLRSNDHGECPNCTAGTGVGKRPENGNQITSSISYRDERGGEHNYLVDESTLAVTSPSGEYDTLSFNTPAVGQHTLTFRNGTQYLFEVPAGDGDIRSMPDVAARLKEIADPHGNSLYFSYDTGGRLESVTDNLGITERTGLTFGYSGTDPRIQSITDWTGRSWNYDYDPEGNLQSVTDPLTNPITYSYHADHLLHEITLPQDRQGQKVKTAFTYYENGQTYDYTSTLNESEALSYDLFRKRTRVTGPRG
ncbi:MAG: DUF6531 domain-containing protein, partial [Sedimenticola sp.]